MNLFQRVVRTIDRNIGYLMIRLGAGLSMAILHGWGKITGGPEAWQKLGGSVELIGISFGFTFWGFMAAFSEFICGLLLAAGLLTRFASFFLVSTMGIAAYSHIIGEGSPELALIYGLIFLTVLIVGPGDYSIDEKFLLND